MSKFKNATVYFAAVSVCGMLIAFADTSVSAAKDAVSRCLNILIPSLFVFMAAAGILIRSGAYRVMSLPFYPIARFLFGMPYELFSVLLISNIAGFPVGASMLCELVESGRIDKKTASLMQCFCFGGGPSFAVGVIGLYLYGDKRIGLIICLSAFIANMAAALIICRLFKLKIKDGANKKPFTSQDMIACTEKAGSSMLMICALVIIFCVVMAGVQRVLGAYIHIHPQAGVLIKTVFEISCITGLKNAGVSLVPMTAALFSFGGVCVLLQIVSTVKGRYSLTPFFVTRFPIAMVSLAIAKLISSRLYGKAEYCIAASKNFTVNFNNFIPSVCLILMIFLLLFKKGVAFFRDI